MAPAKKTSTTSRWISPDGMMLVVVLAGVFATAVTIGNRVETGKEAADKLEARVLVLEGKSVTNEKAIAVIDDRLTAMQKTMEEVRDSIKALSRKKERE